MCTKNLHVGTAHPGRLQHADRVAKPTVSLAVNALRCFSSDSSALRLITPCISMAPSAALSVQSGASGYDCSTKAGMRRHTSRFRHLHAVAVHLKAQSNVPHEARHSTALQHKRRISQTGACRHTSTPGHRVGCLLQARDDVANFRHGLQRHQVCLHDVLYLQPGMYHDRSCCQAISWQRCCFCALAVQLLADALDECSPL